MTTIDSASDARTVNNVIRHGSSAHELAAALDEACEYGQQPESLPVYMEIVHDGLRFVARRQLEECTFIYLWEGLLADKRGFLSALKDAVDRIRKKFDVRQHL